MSGGDAYSFRDPSALVKWTARCLLAQLAAAGVALVVGGLECEVLVGIRDGAYATREAALAAAVASDARARIVGILQTAIYVASAVVILCWIHRANRNARALGARGLRFTPGAAVGWYFVPIANLWMPYRAMKETWQASRRPDAWSAEPIPPLVRGWWLLWLVESALGNASFRLAMGAEEVDALLRANAVALAADLFVLPLCVVFLVLVRRIDAMQRADAARTPQERLELSEREFGQVALVRDRVAPGRERGRPDPHAR
jgi:hypothetical protein